jgi:predicted DNA binding CopG/RHH family protein
LRQQEKPQEVEIVRTTLRLPRKLLKRIKISAVKNDTSIQDLIVRLLTEHCDKEDRK